IEGAPGQPLRNALLRFVAWVASAWLRRRLPAALSEPGYDPFADPDRRAHFSQLAANFRSQRKPTREPGATADPTIADSVANQEPEAGAAVSEDSSGQPVPTDSSHAPADSSHVSKDSSGQPVPTDSSHVP